MKNLTPPAGSYSKGCKIWLVVNVIIYAIFAFFISGVLYKTVLFLMAAVNLLLLIKPYKEERYLLAVLSAVICLMELFQGSWGGLVLIAGFTLITFCLTASAYSADAKQPAQSKPTTGSKSRPIGIYVLSVFLMLMTVLWGITAVLYFAFPERLYPYYYGMDYIWYGDTSFIENRSLAMFIGGVFRATQISVAVIVLMHLIIIANIFGLPLDLCPIKRKSKSLYKGLESARYFTIYRNSMTFGVILAVFSIINTFPRTEMTNLLSGLGYISLIFLLILNRLANKRMRKTEKTKTL